MENNNGSQTQTNVHDDKTYAANYVRRALAEKELEAPDPFQANGYHEALESLYQVHRRGGPERVQQDWEKIVILCPNLVDLVNEVQPEPQKRQLYHADEIDDLPPLTWLIPGEIPERGLTVLFGPSGSGKSFVALDYALQIAQNAPVVYLAAEGETGYADRKRAWCIHHQKGSGQLYFWFGAVNMLNETEARSFIEEIRHLSPRLLVIDTLARCMLRGDENSSKDMGMFIEACATIERELSCARLIIHHTGKNGTTERGSSAMRGASDSMIELKSDDETISLISSKSKDAAPFRTRYLRRIIVSTGEGRSSCVFVPTTRDEAIRGGGELSPKRLLVLETLNLEAFVVAGAKVAVLIQSTEIASSTIYKVLSKLLSAGYVRQAKRGDPYFITEEGKKVLAVDNSPPLS